MKDFLWRAVYDVLCPLLNEADVVLAPRGDWPPFPCTCTLYDDVIDLADATVLVLHKGRLAGISKEDLRRIADQWQWIFANQVFVVLSRSGKISKDVRLSLGIIHCWPVIRFLHSASLRRRRRVFRPGNAVLRSHIRQTGKCRARPFGALA